MGCACTKRKPAPTYLWTSADGSKSKAISTEIEARALVASKGGSYQQVSR